MTTQPDASPTSSRISRRRWLITAAAATGALATAALTGAATAAASPLVSAVPGIPATIRKSPAAQMTPAGQIMNWFAQSSQGGYFNAVLNGYYAEQGIDMTISQGGPQISAIPLVASGQQTFGMVTADQVLLAREEGIPIVMVYAGFQTNPQGLMYHMSNPVSDFSELNGRKVYVSGAGTFWRVIVAKYGLTDVEQFQYTGQAAVFLSDPTAVSQCFVTSEPVILNSQGHQVGYLVNADSGFNPYQNAMICMESTLRSQPDLVQGYVTATLKGWKDYVSNPQPTLDFIKSDFNQEKDLTIERLVFDAEKAGFYTGREGFDPTKLGRMTEQRWADLHDLMRSTDVLKKDVDYRTAFDASFIENAHATLGM